MIIENDNLQSLNLPQLKMVENIQINGHLALQRINLSKIQTVAGDLGISMNNILPDITLSQLKMVIGRMIVRSNYGLTMLNLPNLQTIEGEMSPIYEDRNSISGHMLLQSINLPQLKMVDHLTVGFNDGLTTLHLPQLQSVNRDFRINGGEYLQSLNLSKLQTIGGNINITRSSALLESIDLPQLQTIDGWGYIGLHRGATNINLPQLQSVGRSLYIDSNDNLTCIDLSQLKTVGIRKDGELGLHFRELYSGGTDPINITLPQLQSIEGHLEFRSIYSTLNILIPQLQTVGRDFRIKTSRRITSIALPQLQSVGGIFEFGERFNPTQCDLGSYTNDECP